MVETFRRRELRLNGQKPDGWWRLTNFRVRSTVDFLRIVQFPRCPERSRRIAQGHIDRALTEARRYTDADAATIATKEG